ncbi:hypothetical protein MP638_003473 [Amoeboaphelidium occidentale]|nr:hypothetical protein MP638_003473 [Amoeboaphelidium occidentale]
MKIKKRFNRIKHQVQKVQEEEAKVLKDTASLLSKEHDTAEKNRENVLRRRRNRNLKHVEHAKKLAKIANDQKKQRADNIMKELDEKLKTVDVRRTIFLKVPRSKIHEDAEGEFKKYDSAVQVIQKWWRRISLNVAIEEYKRHSLVPTAAPGTFARLTAIMQNKKALKATGTFLIKAKKVSTAGKGRKYKNPSRVFLSAWVIVHHSKEWMPEMGELEQQLKASAESMLMKVGEVLNGKRGQYLDDFLEAWNTYYWLFDEWKTKDTEQMLNYMFEHYMQVQKVWESVQGHPDVESHWKPQIEKQKAMIRDKVMKIGGKKALERFQDVSDNNVQDSRASDAESAGASPRPRNDSVNSSRYLTEDDTDTAKPSVPQTPKSADVKLPDVLAEYGSFLSNERLAHELIVNPDFELSNPVPNPLEEQIRSTMKKAFFDSIRESIKLNKFDWVEGMVLDIKNQLLSMVSKEGKIANEINEAMDESFIHQQVSKNVFDTGKFILYVVSKMLQLCAPIRDAAIRKVAAETDLVKQLEMILSILDDMKLDLANYRLRSLMPHLMKQAVEYERSKFEKALEAGTTSLAKTEKWLDDAAKKTQEVKDSRNPEKVVHPDNRVRYDAIYFEALISLVFNNDKLINADTLPETFMMDTERIASLQNEAQAITIVAALVMLTKNFIPEVRDNLNALNALKKSLMVLMESATTSIDHLGLQLVEFANGILKTFNKSVSDEQSKTLKQMVEKTLSFNDAVFSLLSRRIARTVNQQLVTGKYKKDSNTGLEVVEKEVESLSQKIFLLSKHNRDVFGPWYDEILSKLQ